MSAKLELVLTIVVVLCCLLSLAACEESVEQNDGGVQEVVDQFRSFRHHLLKRAGFALIPAAFVVGMIVTLLTALTVVSIKSLGVGLVLLVLTIGQIMARALPQIQTISAPPPPAAVPLVYKWK